MAALTRLAIVLGLAFVAAPLAAAPVTMSRDEIITLCQSGVDYSYWWGGGCWRTDGAQHGSCSGSCPDCTHSGSYGADCSGYAAKVWQVPSPSSVSTCAHPYSTYHFTCNETWWDAIARGSLTRGDAASYRSGGCPGEGGHIVIYESGDPWGSMWLYEARGCSYGIVHNSRSLGSDYRAIRRQRLEADCTPATESCNTRDDDCDGATDEGDVCVVAEDAALMPALFEQGGTTDVDGDGRADLCARASSGFRCTLATATGFGASVAGPPLTDAAGWSDVANYGTIRMGDIDADGRADVCARANAGMLCWRSTGNGFGGTITGPTDFSDAGGWDDVRYWSTIRLADIDGDGRDDLCGRYAGGYRCHRATGTGFEAATSGPALSDDTGWGEPDHYGTIRMGDVNGDGRADVCARGGAGMFCWLSDGRGFPTRVTGPAWSDDDGWSQHKYWSTIRLADVDGDGRADLCARTALDFRCHLSTGTGFGGPVATPILADASGWNDLSNYATIRLADVSGDGRLDLCARSNSAVVCWRWTGSGFGQQVTGPALTDAAGFDAPEHYRTLRLADVDADGKADVCARESDRLRCWRATGEGFGAAVDGPEWSDAVGWGGVAYYATIQVAGPRAPACVAATERCNGVDDDCDGETDDGFGVGTVCTVGSGRCAATGTRVCAADGSAVCNALPVECDDGDPCTEDSCADGSGCVHLATANGAPCDDGTACTEGDACRDGACQGTARSCDDGNVCTADGCDPVAGCTARLLDGGCEDGDPCTGGDACVDGACVGGEPVAGCCHEDADCGGERERCVGARCTAILCAPCEGDVDCGLEGARCLVFASGGRCGVPCDRSATACPESYACGEVSVGDFQCVPVRGDCECVPAAGRACRDGHVVWLDSCGAEGARAEDCAGRGCVPTACCPVGTVAEGGVCLPDGTLPAPDVVEGRDAAVDAVAPEDLPLALPDLAVSDIPARPEDTAADEGREDLPMAAVELRGDVPPDVASVTGDDVAVGSGAGDGGCGAAGGGAPSSLGFFVFLGVALGVARYARTRRSFSSSSVMR